MSGDRSGLLDFTTRPGTGHTMPPTSPLFTEFPITCRDVESLTARFVTDTEAARAVLPSALSLPEPATAAFNVLNIPMSGMGKFSEASLVLDVLYEGEPCRYNVLQYVTNDMSFAVGREALGSPKKLAHVTLGMQSEGMLGFADRPEGHRVLTLSLALAEYSGNDPQAHAVSGPSTALRIIPRPIGENRRAVAELLATDSTWTLRSQWSGPIDVSTPARGGADDWNILPVLEVTTGLFRVFDEIVMHRPRLLTSWDVPE